MSKNFVLQIFVIEKKKKRNISGALLVFAENTDGT